MAIYSVSQITRYLRDILDQDMVLREVWVRGEVANLARPGSGHSYFSIRESGATLRCALFRTEFGAHLLSEGAAIIAHGRLSIYEARGDLQLIVDIVQPEGVGELQLRLEQLKLKLETEGLFEPSRKRPIPEFPSRIGVVTSPSGAVWQDIRTIVARRYPLVELLLAPTAVQGDEAVQGIVEAFDALNRTPNVDAVILARGGGSLEDLWAFNEEAVARAVFGSHAPVISGVGHETDVTIADMVADARAPTPSAAAETAVPDRLEIASSLRLAQQALSAAVAGELRSLRDAVTHVRPRLERGRPDLDSLRQGIDDMLGSVVKHLRRDIGARTERAGGLMARLNALSPGDTLRRGYAIVQTQTAAEVVIDAAQVAPGDSVEVTLARGGFDAEVSSTRAGDSPRVRTPADVSGKA